MKRIIKIFIKISAIAFAFFLFSVRISRASTATGLDIQLQVPLFGYTQATDFAAYLGQIYTAALYLLVPFAIVVIIFSGVLWIMSGGDRGLIAKAKERMIYAFIGLGIMLMSYLILSFFNLTTLTLPGIENIEPANPDDEAIQNQLAYGPPVSAGNPGKTTKDVCKNIINNPNLVNAYKDAANKTGVPWEVLAAIHFREWSNSTSNPSNGAGPMQIMNSYGKAAGCHSWPGCLTCASNYIKSMKTSDPATIFCYYNAGRRSQSFCNQSEYVNNDPDNGKIFYIRQKGIAAKPDKRPGALILYTALKNNCQ